MAKRLPARERRRIEEVQQQRRQLNEFQRVVEKVIFDHGSETLDAVPFFDGLAGAENGTEAVCNLEYLIDVLEQAKAELERMIPPTLP